MPASTCALHEAAGGTPAPQWRDCLLSVNGADSASVGDRRGSAGGCSDDGAGVGQRSARHSLLAGVGQGADIENALLHFGIAAHRAVADAALAVVAGRCGIEDWVAHREAARAIVADGAADAGRDAEVAAMVAEGPVVGGDGIEEDEPIDAAI